MVPSPTARTAPVTAAELLSLGGLAALGAVLLAPARHYLGTPEKVRAAKFREDSFPLSTYPMFSEDRRGRIVIPHVVGYSSSGQRILPHYTHYGAGGLNQVRKQIARDVRLGRAVMVAQRYATSIASTRARPGSSDAAWAAIHQREAQIVRIAVVRSRFLFDDWFDGDRRPQAETVFAQCEIGGTAQPCPGARLPRRRSLDRKDAR